MSTMYDSSGVLQALDSIDDGFFLINKDWTITYVNKAFEQITGVTRTSVINQNFFETFPKDPRYSYHEYYLKAVETQQTIRFEEYSHELNLWFLISAFPSSFGLAIYFKDINERKVNELKLIDSENKLKAILNSTPDPNILISPDYKILSMNRAAEERCIKKQGKQIKLGDSFFEYIFNKDHNVVRNALKETSENRAFSYETTIESIDGKNYHMAVFYNPVHDNNGDFIGTSCNAIETTLYKDTFRELLKKDEALQEIARIQSHNLRSPVATILGLIVLMDKQTMTPEMRELVDMMGESTKKLDSVIHDILTKTYN